MREAACLSVCVGFISVAVIKQGERINFGSQSKAYGLPWQESVSAGAQAGPAHHPSEAERTGGAVRPSNLKVCPQ